eukprot:gnl/MRDRNA2_/MRDRNA2_77629_c0_seq2.p1 gnl/MRDRNA2_/MRDRNA2_77629_c0~~gnl/MRDRNA2_/MRDRNA2_77629_c0_seq2.p1  ORF type:complete len:303 (+),score=42.96 gnl/MRDRNA2_/MRDRNA2_77629_c0_seq2:71-979(+)
MLQTRRRSSFGEQAMNRFCEDNGELSGVFGHIDQMMRRQRDLMDKTFDDMTKGIPHLENHRKQMQEMERSMEKSMQQHIQIMDSMTKDMMKSMPAPVQRHREMMDNMMKDMMNGMPSGDMFKHRADFADGFPGNSWPDFSRMKESFDRFDMIRQPHNSRGSGSCIGKPFMTDSVAGAKVGTLEMRSLSKPSNFGGGHGPVAGGRQSCNDTAFAAISSSPSPTSRQCSRVGTPQRSAGRIVVAPAGAGVHPMGPAWKPSKDADHIVQHRVLASASPAPVLRPSSLPARPAGGGKGSFVRWSGN